MLQEACKTFALIILKTTDEFFLLQVCLAFKAITDEDLANDVLGAINDKALLFEDFCCLLSEHRYHVCLSVALKPKISLLMK